MREVQYFGRDQGFFLPGKEEISSFQDRVRKKAAIFVVVAIGNGSRDIKRKQQLCRNYLNRILIFKKTNDEVPAALLLQTKGTCS